MSMGATTQNYIDLQDAGCQVGLVHFMLLGVCVGKASKSATAQTAPTHFTALGAGVGRASKSASAQTGPICEPFLQLPCLREVIAPPLWVCSVAGLFDNHEDMA